LFKSPGVLYLKKSFRHKTFHQIKESFSTVESAFADSVWGSAVVSALFSRDFICVTLPSVYCWRDITNKKDIAHRVEQLASAGANYLSRISLLDLLQQ